MKRFIAITLLLVLSLTCFTACKDESQDTSNTSTGEAVTTNEFQNANGEYVPRHEVVNYEDRTFTIIVMGSAYGTYQSDDFTTESELYGDLIGDAVKKRNDKVEEIYNVTLEVIRSDKVYDDVLLDTQSNLGTYDAVMPTLPQLATLASQSYLYDLNTLENFDSEAPWYDQNCSEAFSFGDKLYFTTGDITILNKVCTPSVLFNKEMAQTYFEEDFYQLVRDKKWTFDKMVELAKTVNNIVTPDGSYSDENTYGMVAAWGNALSFYGCSGELICGKDADNMPYLAIGASERSTTIAQKILSTLGTADWLTYAEEDYSGDIWETSFEVFYNGRALFRPSAFSATTKARSRSNIVFGILPMPLMDETQDQYYSYCGTGCTAGIAIPICAKDPEFSAYMIDAYSAYAKNYLTTAYYDINLLYRDARDDESAEMLEIIFDNIVYDIGECYNFGSLASMFSTLASQHSSDVVSAIQTRQNEAQYKIDELRELYSD